MNDVYYTLSFIALYKFFNIDELIDVRKSSRVISIIMCTAMITGSTYSLINSDYTSKIWDHTVMVGKVYTLLDTYFVVTNYNKFKNMFKEMMLHHTILYLIFMNHHVNPPTLAKGLYVELSTIFLNFGWFMIKLGMQKTMLFNINSALLLISYFIFRVVGFTSLFIYEDLPTYIRCLLLPLLLLNYYWFTLLCRKSLYLLGNNEIKIE